MVGDESYYATDASSTMDDSVILQSSAPIVNIAGKSLVSNHDVSSTIYDTEQKRAQSSTTAEYKDRQRQVDILSFNSPVKTGSRCAKSCRESQSESELHLDTDYGCPQHFVASLLSCHYHGSECCQFDQLHKTDRDCHKSLDHTAGEGSQSFPAHKRQHNTDDVSAVYDTNYDNDYDAKRYRGDN